MIPLNRQYSYIAAIEHLLYLHGYIVSSIAHLSIIVTPYVMWRVIASPKEHIRLDLVTHELQHRLEGGGWYVAVVCTELACLPSGVAGEAIVGTAADEVATERVCTYCVFIVNVRV